MAAGVGLVQSGGFGNFSKNFSAAAAGLLEAEIVTADGEVRIANACTNPDLFWGIKGGGGGSPGILTRLTLRTRELPGTFGAVFGAIKAASDQTYRSLLTKVVEFYNSALFNPHRGETLEFKSDNSIHMSLVFQGLSQQQAEQAWAPFLDWVRAHNEYSFESPVNILTLPARHFWDADYIEQYLPGAMVVDDRPGASRDHALWAGDQAQVGWFVHGYQSAWLPESLLRQDRQSPVASHRHFRACLAPALICQRHARPPAVLAKRCKRYSELRRARAPTCLKAIISNPTGRPLSGTVIIRGLLRRRSNTIRMACSSSTTAWAAKNGARTA